jgi:hypothetical protein
MAPLLEVLAEQAAIKRGALTPPPLAKGNGAGPNILQEKELTQEYTATDAAERVTETMADIIYGTACTGPGGLCPPGECRGRGARPSATSREGREQPGSGHRTRGRG